MNSKKDTQKTPAPHQDWPAHYLLYRLREAGTSYANISRKHGYCPTAAIMVHHRPSWPRMERLLADALGVTPQEIWPSRYHEDGTPRRGRGSPKNNTTENGGNADVSGGNWHGARTRSTHR